MTQLLETMILTLRERRVMLDSDLAQVYEVSTSALNQAVKRNADKFPVEFGFVLTRQELANLKSQNVISSYAGRRSLPTVFTEHGVLMVANVLNSPRAVKVSVALIKTFVRLREVVALDQALAARLGQVESTLVQHDAGIRDLYQRIRPLLLPPEPPPREKIGF